MKQTIEIKVPEGFEAKYNPEENKIELVKKDSKPRTWKEYCKNTSGRKYFISIGGYIATSDTGSIPEGCRHFISSEEEANAFLALMQLRLLRKAWVGDWEPDYSETEETWHVRVWKNYIIEVVRNMASRPLSFPTEEMAKEFAECFKDLIGQAKILL